SSYADFCVMGQRLDERLRARGTTPVGERIDCDGDFEAPAAEWTDKVGRHAAETAQALATPAARPAPRHAGTTAAAPPRRPPAHRPARLHAVPKVDAPTR